jgi:amino acid transporter
MKHRQLLPLLLAVLAVSVLGFAAIPAHAQTPFSIENIGSSLGLGTSDLKNTVINIVKLTLSLLGLIAVTLIIYGGITWTTAAGNEQRVEKAKQIISAAVIGLIVVILSWAIVIFVVNTTSNVTR